MCQKTNSIHLYRALIKGKPLPEPYRTAEFLKRELKFFE